MRKIGGLETVRHVLIDGNNILHKAFHSVKHDFSPHDESRSISLVNDRFLSLVRSYLSKIRDYSTVSVFFDGISSHRISLYPSYKAGRESGNLVFNDSTDFLDSLMKSLLDTGFDIYHSKHHESDDLIASFCAINDNTVRIIISEDKDFFSLLSDPRIIIFKPSYPSNFVDAEVSMDIWGRLDKGKHPRIHPLEVRMFKTLCGDSSDNIKGVYRLRKSTASKLAAFESPQAMLDQLPDWLTDKEKQSLTSSRDQLTLNYEIVGFELLPSLASYCAKGQKQVKYSGQDQEILSINSSIFEDI
jgi:5'-3' exonuclease